MSNVTKLVAEAIRVYPSLYPTRLRVLQKIFGRYSGGYRINRSTGDMMAEHWVGDRTEPEFMEIHEMSPATRIISMRVRMIEEWTSAHAAELAESSVHDDLEFLTELGWPEYSFGERVPVDKMSQDTQDAFWEILWMYEEAYNRAMFIDVNADVQHTLSGKTWNLAYPSVAGTFKRAMAMLEELSGQTREERIAERDEVIAQLVEEILADEKKGQQP